MVNYSAVDTSVITRSLSDIDLTNEDKVPDVSVYLMNNKSSAGNFRLQCVINVHDYIGVNLRIRKSYTLDKDKISTTKEAKRQCELVRSSVLSVLSERFKENTYNLIIPLLNKFLESKRGKLRDTTIDSYEYRKERLEEYFNQFQDFTVERVTPKVVADLINYLEKTKGLGYRSVRDTHTFLYGFMKWCVVEEYITVNPCENTASLINNIPKSNVNEEEFKFLSQEEFDGLWEYLSQTPDKLVYRMGVMYYLAIVYGLRKEEVLALKWDCVDYNSMHLTIKRTRTKGKKIYDFDDVKSKSSYRQYPITNVVYELLKNIESLSKDNNCDSEYVFCWYENELTDTNKKFAGCPFRPDYINKKMDKIMRFYRGITGIDYSWMTFHKLRHSCVSILTTQGWSLSEIQQWVGHSDSRTTKRIYQHFKPDWRDSKVDNLDKLWLNHQ